MRLSSTISESIVIGGVMLHLDWLLELTDLKIDYFTDEANKIIYATLKKLFKNGSMTCEVIDIYASIESNKTYLDKINTAGGIEYLQTLSEIASGKELNDILSHAKTIIDCAYKTELSDTLVALNNSLSQSQDVSKEKIAKTVEAELLGLKNKYGSAKKAEMIGDKIDKIVESMERDSQVGFSGIPTSIPLLNKFCTYQRGEMIVVGGFAKFGKSQFVVDQTYWLAIQNRVPVMILDTELSTKKFVQRMISRITGYSFGFVASGEYAKYEKSRKKVAEAIFEIKNAPITHTYIVDWTYEDIVDEVKRMKIQHNIQVLFYDYLKIEEVGGNVKEADQLGNLTNLLKNRVAGELDIAVMALAQTSDYSKIENGLRLANSNKIKNYASTIMYLCDKTREEYQDGMNELGGNVKLYISHNRNGSQMPSDQQDKGINICFNKKNATFSQAEYQHEEIIELSVEEEYGNSFDEVEI